MRRDLFFPLSLVLLSLFIFPPLSHPTALEQEIKESYIASDYGTTIRLLEQQIKEQIEKASKGESGEYGNLYKKYLLLAHIYMWRLNKPDVALLKYQELNELRQSNKEASKFPRFELFYIAEIYEVKNDYSKAREHYQYLLNELTGFTEKENDDVSILMSEDLIRFVKYQIDGLDPKAHKGKGHKPLLMTLKLSSQLTHQITPFLILVLVPGAEYLFSLDKPVDLVSQIKQSPSDLSSMILNYAFITADSAADVDESSEMALEAYLSKYPESYYSLQLRYLFYKFYKESGQTKKAEKLANDLDKIASKRGMELIIGRDKRFSSPEKTWKTYRNALMSGDIDLAMECYVPGEWKERKIFTLLGTEKMKEIGKSMGHIHKVEAGETMAQYMIIREKDGKEYSYAIRFQNIEGEWKMYGF